MDERTERAEFDDPPDAPDTPDTPDASDATQNVGAESDGDTGADDAKGPSGPLTRARSIGTEAVGVVVDAVLDAL